MLRKMRWRFIGAAMAAIFAVVAVLILSVNVAYYRSVTSRQDATLKFLIETNAGVAPIPPWPEPYSPDEMRYMVRFFTVDCSDSGQILQINREFISSISVDRAEQFARAVMRSRKSSGYYNGYRYMLSPDMQGVYRLFFLNSQRELQSIKALLHMSLSIAAIGLPAVFILVYLFSKQAIAPYIQNIEVQKRFITDAGHELKTPLASIITSADVLAMDYQDNEWIENIRAQSSRLSKLISNLITLSRLDEAQAVDSMAVFSLSDAAWEAVEPFTLTAKSTGRELVSEIEDNVQIYGNKNAVQEMLSVLLDNAIKHSSEGSRIILRLSNKNKKPLLEVINNCDNLDKLQTEHLFDRFYRGDKSRSKKNSFGIGLSIAEAVARNHNAEIKAEKTAEDQIAFKVKFIK